MAEALTGGCQCGAVRYRITGQVGNASICHCRMCQKAHGAPIVGWMNVPDGQLEWTRGEPATFRSSSKAVRRFCAACGTPLAIRDDEETATDVATATLDKPERMPPLRQYGVEGKMSWFDTAHTLPGQEAGEITHSFQHPDFDTAQWPISTEPVR